MKKLLHLFLMMLGSLISFGQNISITFTATGSAGRIDSVKATNLRTGESITLPGDETLTLGVASGISL